MDAGLETVRRVGQSRRIDRPTPPNLDDFTAPLKGDGNTQASFLWNPGTSTWVVCVVYGPDADEVHSVRDQLQAAGADIFRWAAAEGLPDDFA
jgi:hypothetical protein